MACICHIICHHFLRRPKQAKPASTHESSTHESIKSNFSIHKSPYPIGPTIIKTALIIRWRGPHNEKGHSWSITVQTHTLCTLYQINSHGSHHIEQQQHQQQQFLSVTICLFTTTDFSHTYVAGSGPSKILSTRKRLPYLILMLWRWIRSLSFSSCVYVSPYVSSQRISHAQQRRVCCFCLMGGTTGDQNQMVLSSDQTNQDLWHLSKFRTMNIPVTQFPDLLTYATISVFYKKKKKLLVNWNWRK